jgi:copper chaperone CopZ
MAIKNELETLNGVIAVKGSAPDKTITVRWETPATADNIRRLLQEINYPAAPEDGGSQEL